ncbi:hypothetical protein PybrP1_006942 [[Pythium] brassicae (nom. inval.)]|nr:hypothetical protein PybrP1_006942 [[Pythium] brassicae (nom. inval.)]
MASGATPSPASGAVTDADGVVFASADALCAFHCAPTHVARAFRRRLATASQCDARACGAWRRRLAQDTNTNTSAGSQVDDVDDSDVQRVDFLACRGVAQSATTLAFELRVAADLPSVFAGFHDAFFRAFDAMVTSANATYDACQLEFLQQKLLPTVAEPSADALAASFTNSAAAQAQRKPVLVKLQAAAAGQRECVEAIRSVWTNDDEAVTPFVSRQGQAGASATIMLMHVPAAVAERLNDLACVESVLELPAILKLTPFARSAPQLSRSATTTAPALEIRLVNGADQQSVFARLQAGLKTLHGVENAFELPLDAASRPRTLYTKALGELQTWSHAVALALTDGAVEWVDVRSEVTQFSIRGSVYGKAMGAGRSGHRRLDDYAANLVGVDGARRQGILGNNVTVGITDSGLYIDHDQFDQESRRMYGALDATARKVVFYNAWANKFDESADVVCGHGTHVAGILAGSSFSGASRNFGIAENAKIAFMDIGAQAASCAGVTGCPVQLATPADASDLLKSQIDVGARIFSFSWGTPGSDYSAQARDLDAFIYANPEVLVIVAGGNSGENSPTGQGTISSPSGAKNVISVGASLNAAASFKDYPCPEVFNQYSVASFSSAGPTSDGRMKPDVVAPGMIVTSSRSERPGSTVKSSETCDLQGTSQATPVVTGLAVLLYEWLRDGWWKAGRKDAAYAMTKIPAALLKALIIHSGDPLQRRLAPFESGAISCAGILRKAWGVTYPDVYQGYGKPNMTNIAEFGQASGVPTLYFLPNSTQGSEPSVGHEKEVKISFTVPRGVDLRATLVWTDPPGSVRAATMLQHDLDLTVQIRNGSATFAPLTASNATSRDEKNNVEMVQVSYAQLFQAAKSDANSANLIGADGEIIVEAVIYGRSVLTAKTQAFAFVASSSSIGTTSGSAADAHAASTANKSVWTPWTIGAIAVGALVLLLLIALVVRCRSRRSRRSPTPGAAYPGGGAAPQVVGARAPAYYAHTTPAGGVHHSAGGCPYCPFVSPDPVVMVQHVESLHGGGGTAPVMDGNFGLPMVGAQPSDTAPQYMPRYSGAPPPRHIPDDERCPFCAFASSDPVLLVNHVQVIHGQ